jgi:hypothetical protein
MAGMYHQTAFESQNKTMSDLYNKKFWEEVIHLLSLHKLKYFNLIQFSLT